MPPSVNKLYIKVRHGKRRSIALSAEAKKYREHVKKEVATSIAKVSRFPAEDESILYGVEFKFYFQKLENPAWFEKKKFTRGKNKGELKVKRRYKQVDVDNRLKFIQDCLVTCLGIPDDSQIFEGSQKKIQTAGEEHVEATVYLVPREPFLPELPWEESNGSTQSTEAT